MTQAILRIHTSAEQPKPKPKKPYPGFPLTPVLTTKRWCKKIRGRHYYFGPLDDPDGALQRYLDQKDDLHAGRVPRVQGDGFAVRDLCIKFLTTKKLAEEAGELTARSYADYARTCERVADAFGGSRLAADLHPDDFEKLRASWVKKGWGPVTIAGEVQRVRVLFKYGHDNGLLEKYVRYGQGFKRPSRKVIKQARDAKGLQMFEPKELRKILAAAKQPLKAMILLAANCGFGNSDCGRLPLTALDLKAGWVTFPRPKAATDRRAPLWPETVKAIKEALAKRPEAKDAADAGLVFITKYGQSWAKDPSAITKEFRKVLDLVNVDGQRNFYALRHGFVTIGGGCKDQVAVDFIMGHSRGDMASTYRERIEDGRLRDVAKYVHKWLFGK